MPALTKAQFRHAAELGAAWPHEPKTDIRQAINLWNIDHVTQGQLDQLTKHAEAAQKAERERLQRNADNGADKMRKAARPLAKLIEHFTGDDSEPIAVTAGELRRLARAIKQTEKTR